MVEIIVVPQERVVENKGTLKSACETLLTTIAVGLELPGPDGTKHRYGGKVGMTLAYPPGITVDSKHKIGKTEEVYGYYCSRTEKYYDSPKECKAACEKAKQKKGKGKGKADDQLKKRFNGGTAGKPAQDCQKEVLKVRARFKVTRDYKVSILRAIMVWRPKVSAKDQKIVDTWNKDRLDHEEAHVEQIKEIANRSLPEEKEYVVEANDDDGLENALYETIFEDDQKIREAFINEVEAVAVKYDKDRGAPVPSICPKS
jgi:hypothetical protein